MNTARFLGVAAVCVLVGSSAASARDLKTVGGTVFKNVSVVTKSATGIQISHDDGLLFLDYRNLNDADRKEYGYDEANYVEGLKQNVELKKQAQAQAKAVAQAKIARAQAEAADARSWKTYSLTGSSVSSSSVAAPVAPYAPGYGPSTPTGPEYSVESPGFGYGGYYYPGTVYPGTVYPGGVYPAVPQTHHGNGYYPYIRNPYPYNGATMGPVIIRRR